MVKWEERAKFRTQSRGGSPRAFTQEHEPQHKSSSGGKQVCTTGKSTHRGHLDPETLYHLCSVGYPQGGNHFKGLLVCFSSSSRATLGFSSPVKSSRKQFPQTLPSPFPAFHYLPSMPESSFWDLTNLKRPYQSLALGSVFAVCPVIASPSLCEPFPLTEGLWASYRKEPSDSTVPAFMAEGPRAQGGK